MKSFSLLLPSHCHIRQNGGLASNLGLKEKTDLPGMILSSPVWWCSRTGVVNGYTLMSGICPSQIIVCFPVGTQLIA